MRVRILHRQEVSKFAFGLSDWLWPGARPRLHPKLDLIEDVSKLRCDLGVPTLRFISRNLQSDRVELRLFVAGIGTKKCFELVCACHVRRSEGGQFGITEFYSLCNYHTSVL